MKLQPVRWGLAHAWNSSLDVGRPERELRPRENIWASELGSAWIDRYLKMTGVAPSNPPNARSLRKFESGNIWEWLVGLVLKRAGIMIEGQGWVSHQYPGLLEVTGKLDYLAGGKPDWEKAKAEITEEGFPEFIARASKDVIDHFQTKYPNGLKEVVLEIKSTSSYMFERYESTGSAEPKHALQLFHYLKAKDMPEGHIIYIDRDSARMLEAGVLNPSNVEDFYKNDIEKMTQFIRTKTRPDLEPEVFFDEETGKFSANWKVAYSNYLTMLYGYKDQMAYDEKYRPLVAQWNRVLARCANGSNRTALNEEVIVEIKKKFPNFDELVEKAKGKIDENSADGENSE